MTAICERSGVLLLCGSMKPPPGDDTPSAARELLRIVHEELRGKVSRTEWVDLRDLNPPMFDGRPLTAIDRPELEAASERIASASVIVLSCPAYWSGPSGVLKNFLDLLGGPDYREHGPPVFDGTVCAPIVIGADDHSAYNGLTALRASLAHLGAWVSPRAFTVGNPRQIADRARFVQSLRDFADYVAQLVHVGPRLQLPPPSGPGESPRTLAAAAAGRAVMHEDA